MERVYPSNATNQAIRLSSFTDLPKWSIHSSFTLNTQNTQMRSPFVLHLSLHLRYQIHKRNLKYSKMKSLNRQSSHMVKITSSLSLWTEAAQWAAVAWKQQKRHWYSSWEVCLLAQSSQSSASARDMNTCKSEAIQSLSTMTLIQKQQSQKSTCLMQTLEELIS